MPHEYHRFIIGQRGREVRELMERCDVKITVPASDSHSDTITVSGPRRNCEDARQALERRMQQLEAEKEERVSSSCLSMGRWAVGGWVAAQW